jgi:hypothetical protein
LTLATVLVVGLARGRDGDMALIETVASLTSAAFDSGASAPMARQAADSPGGGPSFVVAQRSGILPLPGGLDDAPPSRGDTLATEGGPPARTDRADALTAQVSALEDELQSLRAQTSLTIAALTDSAQTATTDLAAAQAQTSDAVERLRAVEASLQVERERSMAITARVSAGGGAPLGEQERLLTAPRPKTPIGTSAVAAKGERPAQLAPATPADRAEISNATHRAAIAELSYQRLMLEEQLVRVRKELQEARETIAKMRADPKSAAVGSAAISASAQPPGIRVAD